MDITKLPKMPTKSQVYKVLNRLPYRDVKQTMNDVIIEFRNLDPQKECRKKVLRERELKEVLNRLDVIIE